MSESPYASTSYAVACRGTFPGRRVNGGLYTGERFGGDWGNQTVYPDGAAIANSNVFLGGFQTPDADRPFDSTFKKVDGRVFVRSMNAWFPSFAAARR